MLLVSLICHTPIVIRGQHVNWSSFSLSNVRNNRSWRVPFYNIGASACPMVAFSGFNESHKPPPLIVLPHRNGHQNSQQRGYVLHHRFVDCRHGGHRGNTEQVVARCQHPVASDVAVDMLHRAMPHVPLQRLRTAIKMACDGGTFCSLLPIFCSTLLIATDHVMVH